MKVILGIDPGYALTGYGVLKKDSGKITCLDFGVIKTAAGRPFAERLGDLFADLTCLIKKYQPEVMAVEELFFKNNAKTAIKVGQARGVVLLTAQQAGMRICEFTPLQVKQAVTGYGKADKKQVQQLIKTILNLKKIPRPDDAADALAVAVAAASGRNF